MSNEAGFIAVSLAAMVIISGAVLSGSDAQQLSPGMTGFVVYGDQPHFSSEGTRLNSGSVSFEVVTDDDS